MAMPGTSANVATDSLKSIPDDFCVKYLPNSSNLSEKALQKGLNYFTQGYIHDIKIFNSDESVQAAARCWRSMRKNQSPHRLHLEIKNDSINESHCSCKVGLNGHCSHIVGLIKSLQGFKLHNFSNVPEQQSCTSIPQQWHVPRGSKIKPVPINHLVVARPTESRKRKPVTCQIDLDQEYVKS
uniref:SWIM-type domain-containing protein n=1 Tax=Magallana gigas TaxID=29159 RepID=A0A8W8MB74_MAGGI